MTAALPFPYPAKRIFSSIAVRHRLELYGDGAEAYGKSKPP